MKTILLNPGPVNVSARVRAALNGPDLCHRESEYYDLQDSIRTKLLQVFDAPSSEYTAVLLTGSGTSIVEAIVSSSVSETGRLLVVENGVYGERMSTMARLHGIARDVIAAPWTERPPLDAIAARLAERRYDAVAIVHHETTTGLINEIKEVAALCRKSGARLLIDAVSALAGEPFSFREWQPDAVACTANKCVQGLPGLSFAIVRRDFMSQMNGFPERSLYLHLPRHHAEQERRSTPFTPAVQIGYALDVALSELAEESVPGRIARYGRASAIIRDGLTSLGFKFLLPPPLRSTTMTSVLLPAGVSYVKLHDALRRQGFVIYAGQGQLAASLFRVSAMGDVAEEDYRRFVRALETSLSEVRT